MLISNAVLCTVRKAAFSVVTCTVCSLFYTMKIVSEIKHNMWMWYISNISSLHLEMRVSVKRVWIRLLIYDKRLLPHK